MFAEHPAARARLVTFGVPGRDGGWPAEVATFLPPGSRVVMLNRGIAGNRLRAAVSPAIASFGSSGVTRFYDDVLATAGVTDVVIGLGTNDPGLPGSAVPADELPAAGR